jgi:uncharacterized membrane protein
MNLRRLLWALPLVAAVHVAGYYPYLPERMASHFGLGNLPDGWMSKDAFAAFYLGITVFMTALFGGIGALLRVTPVDMINLPNKDYWLAPERREATIAAMGQLMEKMAIATNFLLIAIHQLVIQANLSDPVRLSNASWLLLVGYLGYTAVWTTALIKRFARPASQ